jgi:hypothetical protein
MLDKGAVVALPYGVEGFATPKHLVKEDGSQAQLDEKLEFKVIEFNKDAKRIILSHSRIFEDVAKAEERAEKKAASGAKKTSNKREDSPMIQNQAASTTLGDIDALAEAEIGEWVQADPDAVGKTDAGDANMIQNLLVDLEQIIGRLSIAFMYTSNVRDAERVNAIALYKLL